MGKQWCDYQQAYILNEYINDSFNFEEVVEYYCPKDDTYYSIATDQDGGETLFDESQGERTQSKLWKILND